MSDDIKILKDVSNKLIENQIPFMVTGSMAMNFYIEPRMTRDIDIVVYLQQEDITILEKIFSEVYYIDPDAIKLAIENNKMFNIIHNESIIKIDFILRKKTAYRRLEFERRVKVVIEDFETFMVSKEDLILSKLDWMKKSQSEMQKRDLINLLSSNFDKAYVNEYSKELGVYELLQELENG
ncbi:MAG: nucleotidyl transferase AbiEii/AbiGii toxin family protein [Leptospiraceae bacterium]|nr:nucleotidyl transferase AbiEii/AbiGii toxin family protein [Leptospiraceae bacterium]MCP5499667.1 nucleotidyl transferase AbiEii/AbiGii toxin family protein [Leptospiraceae bacterium]